MWSLRMNDINVALLVLIGYDLKSNTKEQFISFKEL